MNLQVSFQGVEGLHYFSEEDNEVRKFWSNSIEVFFSKFGLREIGELE